MRRLAVWAGVAVLATAVFAAGAAPAEHAPAGQGEAADHTTLWKVANFILLAGGLGYLIHKKGGAFFGARSEQIRQAIDEAARLKGAADARLAAIEGRLADLGAEIEELRRKARQEAAAEGERVRARMRQDLEKVQAQAEREIASATRAARQRVRRYAAELAVGRAEGQIRAQMGVEVEEGLVASAIQELGRVDGARLDQGRHA